MRVQLCFCLITIFFSYSKQGDSYVANCVHHAPHSQFDHFSLPSPLPRIISNYPNLLVISNGFHFFLFKNKSPARYMFPSILPKPFKYYPEARGDDIPS